MKTLFLLPAVFALGLGACASTDSYNDRGYARYEDGGNYRDRCASCGIVQRIETNGSNRTSGGGAVAGAVIGGVLGNQIGSGDGRRAATVAGAVVGGIAGNNIERDRDRNRGRDGYDILVAMDNGDSHWVSQRDLHGVREGSRVSLRGGNVQLR